MKEVFNKFVEEFNSAYCKALFQLESYCEYIVTYTDYSFEDIVHVRGDLGNNHMCEMIICPKSCVINGFGILKPDYFIGLEQIYDENELFRGWRVIDEVPDKFRIEDVERL